MAKRKHHNNQAERRRSRRLASAELVVDYRETETDGTERDTGRRMRKRTKVDYTENVSQGAKKYRRGNGESHDDEWRQDKIESADTDQFEEEGTDAEYGPIQARNRHRVRDRGTTKKATVRNTPSDGQNPIPLSTDKEYDPEAIAAARKFEERKHEYLKSLYFSPNRLKIDSWNVVLYAEDGAEDLWESALSSLRFNGPRKSPPWRELHRLSGPAQDDFSDWAENIRWAKEQHRLYQSVWLEDPHSLETIVSKDTGQAKS